MKCVWLRLLEGGAGEGKGLSHFSARDKGVSVGQGWKQLQVCECLLEKPGKVHWLWEPEKWAVEQVYGLLVEQTAPTPWAAGLGLGGAVPRERRSQSSWFLYIWHPGQGGRSRERERAWVLERPT